MMLCFLKSILTTLPNFVSEIPTSSQVCLVLCKKRNTVIVQYITIIDNSYCAIHFALTCDDLGTLEIGEMLLRHANSFQNVAYKAM